MKARSLNPGFLNVEKIFDRAGIDGWLKFGIHFFFREKNLKNLLTLYLSIGFRLISRLVLNRLQSK